jgi:translocation and assembly module TamB
LLGGDFSQTQQSSTAAAAGGAAVGVGGSIAAGQVNALISGIAPLRGFSTRFNTGQDGSLQTSVVYDISDKFSATATFDQNGGGSSGTTLPGYSSSSSPSTALAGYGGTAAQKTSRTTISVDWHFFRNWLLRGTVGLDADQPLSGLDFLWQYRY